MLTTSSVETTTQFRPTMEACWALCPINAPMPTVELTDGRWNVGSGPECRLVVDDQSVTTLHCLLISTSRQLILRAWNEPTLVNGVSVSEAVLADEDVLTVGKVEFRVEQIERTENENTAPVFSLGNEEDPIGRCEKMLDQVDCIGRTLEDLDAELSGRGRQVDELDLLINQIESALSRRGGLSQATRSAIAKLREQASANGVADASTHCEPTTDDSHPADSRLQAEISRLDKVIAVAEVDAPDFDRMSRDLHDRVAAKFRQLDRLVENLQARAMILDQLTKELEESPAEANVDNTELAKLNASVNSDESDSDDSENAAIVESAPNIRARENWAQSDVELLSMRPGFKMPDSWPVTDQGEFQEDCDSKHIVDPEVAHPEIVESNAISENDEFTLHSSGNDVADFYSDMTSKVDFASEFDVVTACDDGTSIPQHLDSGTEVDSTTEFQIDSMLDWANQDKEQSETESDNSRAGGISQNNSSECTETALESAVPLEEEEATNDTLFGDDETEITTTDQQPGSEDVEMTPFSFDQLMTTFDVGSGPDDRSASDTDASCDQATTDDDSDLLPNDLASAETPGSGSDRETMPQTPTAKSNDDQTERLEDTSAPGNQPSNELAAEASTPSSDEISKSLLDPNNIMGGKEWAIEVENADDQRQIAEERERLGRYIDSFNAAGHEEGEGNVPVAVGQTTAADAEISAGLRSREEAVRQLDELIKKTEGSSPTLESSSDTHIEDVRNGSHDVAFAEATDASTRDADTQQEDDSSSENSEPLSEFDARPEAELQSPDSETPDRIHEEEPSPTGEFQSNDAGPSSTDELSVEPQGDNAKSESDEFRLAEKAVAQADEPFESQKNSDEAATELPRDENAGAGDQDVDSASNLEFNPTFPADSCELSLSIDDLLRDRDDQNAEATSGSLLDQFTHQDRHRTDNATQPSTIESTDTAGQIKFDDQQSDDVRAKLAQMFDLPELGTGGSADTEASESGARGPQEFDTASLAATPPADNHESSANSIDEAVGGEDDDGMPPQGGAVEEDQQPHLANADEDASTDCSPAAEPVNSESELGWDASDPNSINLYMQQLLARNRRQSGVEAEPATAVESVNTAKGPANDPKDNERKGAHRDSATELMRELRDSVKEMPVEEDASVNWAEEGPTHQQDREAVRADLRALREVANVSARGAVQTASRRQLKIQVLTKAGATIMALVFGVAAFIMQVNVYFSSAVIGLGFIFAIDLAITIARQVKSGPQESETVPETADE